MAGKPGGSGLHNYVQGKNALPEGSLDFIKMKHATGSATRSQQRANGHAQDDGRTAQRLDTREQRGVLDTGSTGTASHAVAADRAVSDGAFEEEEGFPEGESSSQQGGDERSPGSDAGECDDDDDIGDNLPHNGATFNDLGKVLTPHQMQMMQQGPHGAGGRANGSNFAYMTGDSYPSTTSGRPSAPSESTEHVDVEGHWTRPSQRAPNPKPVQTQHPQGQQPVRKPNSHAQFHAQQPTSLQHRQKDARPVGMQVNEGFSFGQPPSQKGNVRSAAEVQQQTRPEINVPQQSVPSNIAQQGSTSKVAEKQIATMRQRQVKQPLAAAPEQVQQNPQQAQVYPTPPKATKVQQQNAPHQPPLSKTRESKPTAKKLAFAEGVEYGNPADEEVEDPPFESEQCAPANGPPSLSAEFQHPGADEDDLEVEEQVQLDYEPPDLHDMRYEDLKAQSFDVDPNATAFQLPGGHNGNLLTEKLALIATLEPALQSDFFASLSLNEWEQSGDWFLERFGEMIGRLKNIRQEKRKAALLFEDEIERRHDAIGNKRKQVEASLNEMRESGGKVLERTPKKTKTK